jgi:AcrR family transcriptional regulator
VSGWERRRTVLLNQYERVALELFAERGYRGVTTDEIAVAAGVTPRTLFRYFPTKQDCLLGFPRRGMAAEVELIEDLAPDPDPIAAAWALVREFFSSAPADARVLALWRQAAIEAPEVVDRVRGERMHLLNDALMAYCERSLGVDANVDPRPRTIAGVLMGIEFNLVETATRAPDAYQHVIESADEIVSAISRQTRGRAKTA